MSQSRLHKRQRWDVFAEHTSRKRRLFWETTALKLQFCLSEWFIYLFISQTDQQRKCTDCCLDVCIIILSTNYYWLCSQLFSFNCQNLRETTLIFLQNFTNPIFKLFFYPTNTPKAKDASLTAINDNPIQCLISFLSTSTILIFWVVS